MLHGREPFFALPCSTPSEVFERDGRSNDRSENAITRFNELMGKNLTLAAIQAVYEGRLDGVSTEVRQEIHDNAWQLFRFARDNLRLTPQTEQTGEKFGKRQVVAILNEIYDRVFLNTLQINNNNDALDTINQLEERCPEAQEVTEILGWNTLRCSDRVREQLLRLRGQSELTPVALVQKIWPVYAKEIKKLHRELTDSKAAENIMKSYQAVFVSGWGMPGKLAIALDMAENPINWVRTFYKSMGVFLFVNLIDREKIYSLRPDSSIMTAFLSNMRDATPHQLHPCVGRSTELALGRSWNYRKQKQIGERMTRLSGEKYAVYGGIGIVASCQQAHLRQEILFKGNLLVRLAAKKPTEGEENPPCFTFSRATAVDISAQTSHTIPQSTTGVLFGPEPALIEL